MNSISGFNKPCISPYENVRKDKSAQKTTNINSAELGVSEKTSLSTPAKKEVTGAVSVENYVTYLSAKYPDVEFIEFNVPTRVKGANESISSVRIHTSYLKKALTDPAVAQRIEEELKIYSALTKVYMAKSHHPPKSTKSVDLTMDANGKAAVISSTYVKDATPEDLQQWKAEGETMKKKVEKDYEKSDFLYQDLNQNHLERANLFNEDQKRMDENNKKYSEQQEQLRQKFNATSLNNSYQPIPKKI